MKRESSESLAPVRVVSAEVAGENEVWVRELSGDGDQREGASRRLYEVLLRAARSEVGRRASRLRLAGPELDDIAHQAAADVAGTARVLVGMLATFGLTGKPWPDLAAMANPFAGRANWIGPSHHIQWSADGKTILAFGKNNGRPLDETDPGFLRWVIDKDFPAHVKEVCRAALQLRGEALTAWIVQRYPRPASTEVEHV